MYEKVKRFYDLGLYTAQQVRQFAEKGKLTEEEFREITGDTTGEEAQNGEQDVGI